MLSPPNLRALVLRFTVGLVAALGLALPVVAQIEPTGPAFRVGVGVVAPDVAVDDLGGFTVVWIQDRTAWGRIYDARDIPLDRRFRLAEGVLPLVAGDGAGNHLIAWRQGFEDPQTHTFRDRVTGRFFDPLGRPVTGRLRIDGEPRRGHSDPVLARNRAGDTVVLWETWLDFGRPSARLLIRGQRFGPFGERRGGPIDINPSGPLRALPDVGLDEDGRFVVAWKLAGFDLPSRLLVQRLRFDGTPRGGLIEVLRGEAFQGPRVAVAPDGRFLVVWSRSRGETQRLEARPYDPFGRPVDDVILVADLAPRLEPGAVGDIELLDVAADRFGNTVVLWVETSRQRVDPDAAHRLMAQVVDPSGRPFGEAVEITRDPALSAALDLDGNGGLVVVWPRFEADGGGFVMAQRFRLVCAPGWETRCGERGGLGGRRLATLLDAPGSPRVASKTEQTFGF